MDRRTFLKIMGIGVASAPIPAIALSTATKTPKGVPEGSEHIASIPLFVVENYKKETGKDLLRDQEAMKEFLTLRKEFNV